MKSYLFLAEGFEEIEAITIIDILRRANIDLKTISISSRKEVMGTHGILVNADNLFTQIDFSQNEMLILPGGMPGTKNLGMHEGLRSLLIQQHKDNKFIGAICAAPSILGDLGFLEGKEAICYPGFEPQLIGALISTKQVVQSGKIITAKGIGSAIEFAILLVKLLKGEAEAKRISEAIGF